jgi:predicted component of type VI protein secretion system
MKIKINLLKKSIYILIVILIFFETIALAADPLTSERFQGNVYINGVIVGQGHLIDARNVDGLSKVRSESDRYTNGSGSYGYNDSALFYVEDFSNGETVYFYVDDYSSNTSIFEDLATPILHLYITYPTVTEVNTSKTDGNYTTGEPIDINVIYSQIVNVNTTGGTPVLSLNTSASAAYIAGSGTDTLTFRYIVGAGQNSQDLDYSSTSSLALNGSTIKDVESHVVNNTLPAVGTFAGGHAIVIDTTAPILTSAHIQSNNANSTKAKAGDQITVSLTANESLNTNPAVTIAGHASIVSNTGGNSYNATYTMVTDDTEGTISFEINFNDAAGNAGTAVTLTTDSRSVTFDKSAPILTSAVISSNNANSSKAKAGDQVTVSLTANESLNANPAVTIAGHASTISSTGGNSYNATYTMVTGDAEGTISFAINFNDAAGNAGTAVTLTTDSRSVTFDKSAPALTSAVISSNNANSTKAKAGDQVTVSLTANESLNANPAVTIAGHASTISSTGGNSYNATYTMVTGDAEGTISFAINFNDAAGNAGIAVTSTTDSSSVTFDKSAPTLTSVVISSNNLNPKFDS